MNRMIVAENLWFCGCVRDEGNFHILGPFATWEEATNESDDPFCSNAHLATRGISQHITVHPPCVTNTTVPDAKRWRDLHNNNANTT